jgi:hypothetical protein
MITICICGGFFEIGAISILASIIGIKKFKKYTKNGK